MTIEIALADVKEYRVIADVWDRSWLSSNPPEPRKNDLEELIAKLHDPAWEIWVTRDSGRIVAFMAVERAANWLAQLFVAPDAQSQGIGLSLFRLAAERMPDGFSFRTDDTNLSARRFYERHGCILDRVDDHRAYYTWRPETALPG